jgi:hypothetical protein
LEETLFWIVFAAIGGYALVNIGWRYRRRLRPRSDTVEIATNAPVRRGETIDLAITIRDGSHTGGVFCLERYDVEMSTKDGTERVTEEALAHEDWREVAPSEAQHGLSFVVPREGPYSYARECLSFEWHAEALEIAKLRPDAVASCTFEVRP